MAERKIIWTVTAQRQRRSIFEYWNKRNGSTHYSKALIKEIRNRTAIIAQNPLSFKETSFENIRVCPMGHFSIFYVFTNETLQIISFWDNRQDPDKLFDLITQQSL